MFGDSEIHQASPRGLQNLSGTIRGGRQYATPRLHGLRQHKAKGFKDGWMHKKVGTGEIGPDRSVGAFCSVVESDALEG